MVSDAWCVFLMLSHDSIGFTYEIRQPLFTLSENLAGSLVDNLTHISVYRSSFGDIVAIRNDFSSASAYAVVSVSIASGIVTTQPLVMRPNRGPHHVTKLVDVDDGSGRLFFVSTNGSDIILHELSAATAVAKEVVTFNSRTVAGPSTVYSSKGLFFTILDQDLVGVNVFNGSVIQSFSNDLFAMTLSLTLDDRTFGLTTELWGLALPSVGIEIVFKVNTRSNEIRIIGQAGCSSSLYSLLFDPSNNILVASTANALKLITVNGTVTCKEYAGFEGVVWLRSKNIANASHSVSAFEV